MDPIQALEDLLLSLFSSSELRRFIVFLTDGRKLAGRLPDGPIAPVDLVHAVVEILERDHRIDPAFFDALVRERPRREGEIRKVAAAWAAPPVAHKATSSPPAGPIDIFIAHATADLPAAKALRAELSQRGLAAYVDDDDLLPGDDWDIELPAVQKRAKVTVILVGERYDAAFYLREEVASAIAHARADADAHRVVPVFLKGRPASIDKVPYGLRVKAPLDWPARGGAVGVADALLRLFREAGPTAPEELPSPPVLAELSQEQRFDALVRLLPAQLATLLFRVRAPAEDLPPASEPRSLWALSVVQWLDQQPVEVRLRFDGLLRQMAPGLFE